MQAVNPPLFINKLKLNLLRNRSTNAASCSTPLERIMCTWCWLLWSSVATDNHCSCADPFNRVSTVNVCRAKPISRLSRLSEIDGGHLSQLRLQSNPRRRFFEDWHVTRLKTNCRSSQPLSTPIFRLSHTKFYGFFNEWKKSDQNTCPLSQTRSSFHSVQMRRFDAKKVKKKSKRTEQKKSGNKSRDTLRALQISFLVDFSLIRPDAVCWKISWTAEWFN